MLVSRRCRFQIKLASQDSSDKRLDADSHQYLSGILDNPFCQTPAFELAARSGYRFLSIRIVSPTTLQPHRHPQNPKSHSGSSNLPFLTLIEPHIQTIPIQLPRRLAKLARDFLA